MLRTSDHPTPSPVAAPGAPPCAGRPAGTPRPVRRAAALAAAVALAAPAGALLAAPAAATTDPGLAGACADDQGVTVVVDATALGGAITAGCAPEAGVTGTEALLAAGFTEGRDPSGFICAVDGLPDPCPTEFTGQYWSYWFAEPGADTWTMYEEGSDTAVTAAGAVEGWRYGDGSEGPPVALPVVAATDEATDEVGSDAGGEEAVGQTADDDATGPAAPLLVGLGLLAALALAAVVVARRRSTPATDGAAGEADDAPNRS